MQKGIVAEDNKGMREFLVGYVTQQGFQVDAVENAGDLIEKVSQNTYDFVITDYRMPPGMNGLQAIAEIKRLKPGLLVCLASTEDPQLIKLLVEKAQAKPDYYFDKTSSVEKLNAFLDLVRKSS